jgi:phosphoenolpyruvate carboxykinase (ATP)
MSVPPLFKMPKNLFFSIGLPKAENTFYQLSEKKLQEQIESLKENRKASDKNLPVRFIVKNSVTANAPDASEISQPIDEKYFDSLFQKMISHLDKKQIWIRDTYSPPNLKRKLKIRHINEDAKGDLFVLKTFSKLSKKELENFDPDWYFIHTPAFVADPEKDGTNHTNFIIISFSKKVVLIAGVPFTKKLIQVIFSDLNFVFTLDKK